MSDHSNAIVLLLKAYKLLQQALRMIEEAGQDAIAKRLRKLAEELEELWL